MDYSFAVQQTTLTRDHKYLFYETTTHAIRVHKGSSSFRDILITTKQTYQMTENKDCSSSKEISPGTKQTYKRRVQRAASLFTHVLFLHLSMMIILWTCLRIFVSGVHCWLFNISATANVYQAFQQHVCISVYQATQQHVCISVYQATQQHVCICVSTISATC